MEYQSYSLSANPSDLLEAFRGLPGVFLLESSTPHPQRGRYSFLGCDPFAVVSGNDLKSFEKLKKVFYKFSYRPQLTSVHTPFPAGMMGYLSYDLGLKFEKILSRHKDRSNIPGFLFGFYDTIITVDHFKKVILLSSSGLPETNKRLRQKRAVSRLKYFEKIMLGFLFSSSIRKIKPAGSTDALLLKSNFTKSQYCQAVKKALEYIRRGDIYQVNLAQEFLYDLKTKVDTVSLYKILRDLSPSCFGGYFNPGRQGFQIVSSSPELFLHLRKGIVTTRPMKGTRPRGRTALDDRGYRQSLIQSAKEKAELLMITDLERNDLGRACEFGSVKVKRIREIEKYRTVYQATATVTGKLAKGKDGFDLLTACFPGGSVTGCPKIRAMQIIDKLEPSRRGIYTGAMGYMSFSADMAFNVLIRTMLVQENGKKIHFHVGSGIVADSDPELEYNETLLKARAMQESLARM